MPLLPVKLDDGEYLTADDFHSQASSVVNWDIDDPGINRPRPAVIAHSLDNFTTDPIIGMERWKTYVVIVTEGTTRRLWAVHDLVPGTAMALSDTGTAASLLDGTKRPVFVIGTERIYVTGGGQILYWEPSMALASTIAASPNCTHIAALGQRLVANDITDKDIFRWSDLGEASWNSWPAANYATADARPDELVSIYENINELYIVGQNTLETYAIGVDPYLPFDRVSTINLGTAAQYLFVRLDEAFILMDDRRNLVLTDGRQKQVISDAIAWQLRRFTTVSDAFAWRESRDNYNLVCFAFPTEDRVFVYNLNAKRWTEFGYWETPFQRALPAKASITWPPFNTQLFGLDTGGLYKYDTSVTEDSTDRLIQCDRITGWTDFGTAAYKRSSRLRFVLRRGTVGIGAATGSLEVRTQEDDSPWSDWQQINLGDSQSANQVEELFMGGVFVRRRYHIRYTNDQTTSLVGLYDDVVPLEGNA